MLINELALENVIDDHGTNIASRVKRKNCPCTLRVKNRTRKNFTEQTRHTTSINIPRIPVKMKMRVPIKPTTSIGQCSRTQISHNSWSSESHPTNVLPCPWGNP